MLPPPRQPGCRVLRKNSLHHRSKQERGKCVACVRAEGKLGTAHAVLARRLGRGKRVITCSHKLVAHFEGVAADYLGKILLKREIFSDLTRSAVGAQVEEAATAGVTELR